MTDKEIVLSAIKKAENNLLDLNRHMSVDTFKEKVLFSHDFAKAYWGKEDVYESCGCIVKMVQFEQDYFRCPTCFLPSVHICKKYVYHLRQIVILPDDEQLKYLEKFL